MVGLNLLSVYQAELLLGMFLFIQEAFIKHLLRRLVQGWEDKMQGRGESQHRVSATEYKRGWSERGWGPWVSWRGKSLNARLRGFPQEAAGDTASSFRARSLAPRPGGAQGCADGLNTALQRETRYLPGCAHRLRC